MSINLVQNTIINKLKTDSSIFPSPFVAVLNRWASEGGSSVPGSTPEVWDSISGKMLPHISVLDGGDAVQSGGAGFGGRVSNPVIVGMVRANDAGRSQLGILDQKIKTHFDWAYFVVGDNDQRQTKVWNRMAVEEGSELGYNGMIATRWILEVVSIDRFMLR